MRPNRFTRVLALTFALAFATSLAHAQNANALVTLPNGQIVPCSHPIAIAAGYGCTATATTIATLPTVLPPEPATPFVCPAGTVETYPGEACAVGTLPPPVVGAYRAGACYGGPYISFQLRVSSIGGSVMRRGIPLVSAEWLPNRGANVSGLVSFYADRPPLPLTEIACPSPVGAEDSAEGSGGDMVWQIRTDRGSR